MYVFHICEPAGICMCELCGTKATASQRGVSAWRESSDAGKTSISVKLKSFFVLLLMLMFNGIGWRHRVY
jgi:hypothetical protein